MAIEIRGEKSMFTDVTLKSFMRAWKIIFSLLTICGVNSVYGIEKPKGDYLALFWNLENFFDTRFEQGEEDGEFSSMGTRRWGWRRFAKKRDGIAKVLIDIGSRNGPSPGFPVLAGFAEVENRYVLNQLIYETPLAFAGYRIIHRDSPDRRGIDVALLYRKEYYKPIKNTYIDISKHISIQMSSGFEKGKDSLRPERYTTREILYSKGVLHDLDTIHLFVNHWPSKYGGEKASAQYRVAAADALISLCDSILKENSNANLLIMGDFNDTPDSDVIMGFVERAGLVKPFRKRGEGTIKYEGGWEQIDMFIVSKNLMDKREPISVSDDCFEIFDPGYLLERDRNYTGRRPKRTYLGPRYNGGLSDHLPVVLKIERNW